MIRMMNINKFKVQWQKPSTNGFYDLRISPEFDRSNYYEAQFCEKFPTITYPHHNGLIDTTISDKAYYLLITYDDELTGNRLNGMDYVVQLKKRVGLYIDAGHIPANNSLTQGFADGITNQVVLQSVDGTASIQMGEGGKSKTTCGATMMLTTEDGFTRDGSETKNGMPDDSCGGIMDDPGLLEFIPSIIPFKAPNKLPSAKLALKIAGLVYGASQLTNALSKLK
jgi:hypothetical protein